MLSFGSGRVIVSLLLALIKVSIFGDFPIESLASPHSYVNDKNCPRYVLGETSREGFGDQLEHFIYSLYIARLMGATVITAGFETGPAQHSGTREYAKVAGELLGIDFAFNETMVMQKFNPKKYTVPYDQAISMFEREISTPCNSMIISDITSCGKRWCHAIRQFDSLRDTIWMLRRNSAPYICNEWRRKLVQSSGSDSVGRKLNDPSAVRVVWHVRSGDICLHCNDTDYFTNMDRLLKDTLGGYKYTVTFESQKRMSKLESLFPDYMFHINSSLVDTVCDFISSDILITSGSSLAPLVAAAGGTPWHPIVFEELIKDQASDVVTHHYFAHDEAVLLNNGMLYTPLNDVLNSVRSVLYEKFGPPAASKGSTTKTTTKSKNTADEKRNLRSI